MILPCTDSAQSDESVLQKAITVTFKTVLAVARWYNMHCTTSWSYNLPSFSLSRCNCEKCLQTVGHIRHVAQYKKWNQN